MQGNSPPNRDEDAVAGAGLRFPGFTAPTGPTHGRSPNRPTRGWREMPQQIETLALAALRRHTPLRTTASRR